MDPLFGSKAVNGFKLELGRYTSKEPLEGETPITAQRLDVKVLIGVEIAVEGIVTTVKSPVEAPEIGMLIIFIFIVFLYF